MKDLARLHGKGFLVIGRAGMDLYADPPGTRLEDALQFTAALGGSSANSPPVYAAWAATRH